MKVRTYIDNLRHKYIRAYNSVEAYQQDIDNRNIEECAYSVVNKNNTTIKTDYQPSHRTTNKDNEKIMHYFTNDDIRLWAGLKIIWGYFGWEENHYNFNNEDLLGGKCYLVKPMITLRTVPDLYQYQHLVNLLRDIKTVVNYEDQDFSTIKVASYLVNINNYDEAILIPQSFTNLDNLEDVAGPLFDIKSYNVSFTGVLNLNNISSVVGSKFPFAEPSLVTNPIKINLNSVRNIDNKFWNYEKRFIDKYYPNNNTESYTLINKIMAFGNLNNIEQTNSLCLVHAENNIVFGITDNYINVFSDNVISSNIFDIIARDINININKIINYNSSSNNDFIINLATAISNNETSHITISKLHIDFNSKISSPSINLLNIKTPIGKTEITNLIFDNVNNGVININDIESNKLVKLEDININYVSNSEKNININGNVTLKNISFDNNQEGSINLTINKLYNIENININTKSLLLNIKTDNFDCYNAINILGCNNLTLYQNDIKLNYVNTPNTIYNNSFNTLRLYLNNLTNLNYKYIEINNNLETIDISSNGSDLINGNAIINFPDKIYKSINLQFNINYNETDDYEHNISLITNDIKFIQNCNINTNIKKNINIICKHTDNENLNVKNINIYGNKDYIRKLSIELLNQEVFPEINLHINNINSFKLYLTDNSIDNKLIITDLIAGQELDLTNVNFIYGTWDTIDDFYRIKTITITEENYKVLKLKHYVANLDYGFLCDELDFNVVKQTLLGNLDNPYLGVSKTPFNPTMETNNQVTLNRNLWNKFTSEEQAQIRSCFFAVNINEYAD